MAFVVEDGTGLADANSYASVEATDAYFANRGISAWGALSQEAKEFALVNASEYIDVRWGKRFPGRTAFTSQALYYPRVAYCITDTEIVTPVPLPLNLVKAAMQYALIAKDGPLAPNPQTDSTGVTPIYLREKVGPIEEERRWSSGSTATATVASFKPYSIPDALIMTLVNVMGRGRVFR